MAIKEVPVIRVRHGTGILTGAKFVDITYDIVFPSTPRVFLTMNYKGNAGDYPYATNVTTSGFRINYWQNNTGTTFWMAITNA